MHELELAALWHRGLHVVALITSISLLRLGTFRALFHHLQFVWCGTKSTYSRGKSRREDRLYCEVKGK